MSKPEINWGLRSTSGHKMTILVEINANAGHIAAQRTITPSRQAAEDAAELIDTAEHKEDAREGERLGG